MKSKKLIFTAAALTFLLSALLSICLGAVNMTIPALWQALCSGPQGTGGYIFWYQILVDVECRVGITIVSCYRIVYKIVLSAG